MINIGVVTAAPSSGLLVSGTISLGEAPCAGLGVDEDVSPISAGC